MKDVEKLSLVFVETLYLYIKDGAGIHIDAVVLLDVFCQTNLVLILNIHELLLTFLIVSINRQLLDMGQVGDPLIANLIELLAPTVGISTESMPSTRNNSVEVAESDTNPIVADALNPFSSLHISLDDATKDFTPNGEEIYFINIEGREFRIVEPECNDYNGIIDKYRKLLPSDLHDDMEKLRNYARFTAGEVERLDRETMIGIADFEKRHVARRSQFPAMGDFAAEYRHALHIIKNPDALRYDRPAKRELNRCAYRALAMLLKLDELAPICLPATVHNASKTLTATLIEIPQGVVLTDLSLERRDDLAIEKGMDVRFLIKISELQVLDYISGIAGRSGENIMICSGDDTTSEVLLPGDANMIKLLALPTERMFGKLGDSVGGERSFGPANMRVITRGLKRSLDGLEKNMLELVLTPFGISEAELAAIRTRINNILDAVEHHQILVYDEKDWERSGLSDLAEYTENESGGKQCANVYAIFEGN